MSTAIAQNLFSPRGGAKAKSQFLVEVKAGKLVRYERSDYWSC